jgi:hypothetical protein
VRGNPRSLSSRAKVWVVNNYGSRSAVENINILYAEEDYLGTDLELFCRAGRTLCRSFSSSCGNTRLRPLTPPRPRKLAELP